jgi:DnaJ family protein C protein 4
MRYKKMNYYELLGVNQDCSQKDIKGAFIDLSKKFHPDTKSQSNDDKIFKEILEAYQILSKPHSRKNYDLSLRGIHTVNYVTEDIVYRPYESNGNKQRPYDNSDNYYGVKGIKKIANWKIVVACAIFGIVGFFLQMAAIKYSFTFKSKKLDERNTKFAEQHKATREEALKYGNDENISRWLERMEKVKR